MDNYADLQKQIIDLKNALGSFNNNEKEIEDSFIYHLAQEEDLGGEIPQQNPPIMNRDDSNKKNDEKEPDDKSESIEEILASDDEREADIVEWDNFSIARSDEYANKLQQEQGLNIDDANAKSYYIRYKTPTELLAVQGRMFGINRNDGEGIKTIGGYGTKEEIGKDLEYLKKVWESGFPVDEKDNLLVTLDELSPALVAFEDKRHEENLKNPPKQEVVEVEKKPEKEMPEVKPEVEPEETKINEKSRTKPTPTSPKIPAPIGKLPAFILNNKMKRESRRNTLNNIFAS